MQGDNIPPKRFCPRIRKYHVAQVDFLQPNQHCGTAHQQEQKGNHGGNQEDTLFVHHAKLFPLPGAKLLRLKNVLAPHIGQDC